jgi:rod shape-determining protein MreB
VISLGDIVVSQSIRVGGDEMDDAIMNFCKREHQLLIGHQTAEDIKHEAGSANPLDNEIEIEIRGRDLGSGLPRAVKLNSANIRTALDDPIQQIIAAVRDTLDRTPPELAGDLMERGMTLAGGGALLHGFAERMSEECQMPARLAESPLTCVATGSGQALEEFEAIKRALKNSRVRRRY